MQCKKCGGDLVLTTVIPDAGCRAHQQHTLICARCYLVVRRRDVLVPSGGEDDERSSPTEASPVAAASLRVDEPVVAPGFLAWIGAKLRGR